MTSKISTKFNSALINAATTGPFFRALLAMRTGQVAKPQPRRQPALAA
ncbi:hypothetical protein DB30_01162 [Enhygromyxa salina]|uniref:Uncharacterized protein n=1 Tax=Enhygromyxa salina TaxID=215803 RepID=A0A0C1Z4V0_9BACT|nr:hypothetical protein [Enhygromyxa salina]KIG12674.1 hypothetical protein DB30_01162 [Enhygromyxa salina]